MLTSYYALGEDPQYTGLLYHQHGHSVLVGTLQVGKTMTKLRLHNKPPSTGLEKPVELDSKTVALIDVSENKPVSTWQRLAIDDLPKVLVYHIEHEEEM